MGAWSTALYGNDTTCDVKDTYMGLLQDQLSNQEAYEKTMEMYQDCIGDEEDEPLLWFALAETQWKVGRLMPNVKEKALEWVDKDGGMALWEDSGVSGTEWRKTLDKLKVKLNSPMPPEKKIRKPTVINQNLWNIGDVYAYQFHTEELKKHGTYGKYLVLQKIGAEQYIPPYENEKEDISLMMRIHVFDKLFDNVPAPKDIEGVRLLPIGPPTAKGELSMSILMELYKKKDYPAQNLSYMGNVPVPANKLIFKDSYPVLWNNIGYVCDNFFRIWQGKEYETVEEGVFRYIQPD